MYAIRLENFHPVCVPSLFIKAFHFFISCHIFKGVLAVNNVEILITVPCLKVK